MWLQTHVTASRHAPPNAKSQNGKHLVANITTRCNILQNIATHCNTACAALLSAMHAACRVTLQHIATRQHCNTCNTPATHCNTLQHTATHLQHTLRPFCRTCHPSRHPCTSQDCWRCRLMNTPIYKTYEGTVFESCTYVCVYIYLLIMHTYVCWHRRLIDTPIYTHIQVWSLGYQPVSVCIYTWICWRRFFIQTPIYTHL